MPLMATKHCDKKCPNCNGTMYIIYYEPLIKLLRQREWRICKRCKFQEEINTGEKSIFSAWILSD